jgi:hypothetical protein
MRHLKYDPDPAAKPGRRPGKAAAAGPRAFSTGGLLDDSWFARVGWTTGGGSGKRGKGRKGRRGSKNIYELLVFGGGSTYGLLAYSKSGFGGIYRPGGKGRKGGYQLIAEETASGAKKWARKVPVRITAMALAGGTLFAAGLPDTVDEKDPWAALEGRKGGVLSVFATADGKTLAEQKLESPPVYDGLAAANGRLYLSTADGRVLCFGK